MPVRNNHPPIMKAFATDDERTDCLLRLAGNLLPALKSQRVKLTEILIDAVDHHRRDLDADRNSLTISKAKKALEDHFAALKAPAQNRAGVSAALEILTATNNLVEDLSHKAERDSQRLAVAAIEDEFRNTVLKAIGTYKTNLRALMVARGISLKSKNGGRLSVWANIEGTPDERVCRRALELLKQYGDKQTEKAIKELALILYELATGRFEDAKFGGHAGYVLKQDADISRLTAASHTDD